MFLMLIFLLVVMILLMNTSLGPLVPLILMSSPLKVKDSSRVLVSGPSLPKVEVMLR